MYRQPKDFSKGKIYCIRNNINDEIYIGSTCQSLSQRMAQHRKAMTANQRMKLYKSMKELGRENFYIELLEECPCENFIQLTKREGELIREHNSELNHMINGRTKKEYQEENKEYWNEWKRNHYEENKERISEQRKTYRENNKEKLNEKQREWYTENKHKKKEYEAKNRDEICRKKKEYYEKNKDEINRKRREKRLNEKQGKDN